MPELKRGNECDIKYVLPAAILLLEKTPGSGGIMPMAEPGG